MDYTNKIDFISQKIKYQLNAKGIDTLTALRKYFSVFHCKTLILF